MKEWRNVRDTFTENILNLCQWPVELSDGSWLENWRYQFMR
jgi:hypothetical protein